MTTMCLMRSSGAGGPWPWPWPRWWSEASAGVAPSASRAMASTGTRRSGRFMELLPKFAVPQEGGRLGREDATRAAATPAGLPRELGARVDAPVAVGEAHDRHVRPAGVDSGHDAGAPVGEHDI